MLPRWGGNPRSWWRPPRPPQGCRYFAAAAAPPHSCAAPGDGPGLPPGLREALTKFGVLGG